MKSNKSLTMCIRVPLLLVNSTAPCVLQFCPPQGGCPHQLPTCSGPCRKSCCLAQVICISGEVSPCSSGASFPGAKNFLYVLYQLPRVANCHKLRWLKTAEIISQFWRLEVQKSKCQQGHAVSEGSREKSILDAYLWVVARSPWPSSIYRCILPLSASVVTWYSLCLCPNCRLLKKAAVIGLEPILIQ